MNEEFYMAIARHHLEKLSKCPGPISFGVDGYSEHFRHAVICSVFSAMAVEHAISKFLWFKCCLSETGESRRKGAKHLKAKLYNMSNKLDFFRSNTNLSPSVIDRMDELFRYRNWLVHSQLQLHEGKGFSIEVLQTLNNGGRKVELDEAMKKSLLSDDDEDLNKLAEEVGEPYSEVSVRGLGTSEIEYAEENLRIAEAAIHGLQKEFASLADSDSEAA